MGRFKAIMAVTPKGKITSTGTENKRDLGGITNKCIATTEAGQKVMVKASYSENGGEVVAERVAYVLGWKMGLHVNEVQIIDFAEKLGLRTKWASVHTWNNNFKAVIYCGKRDVTDSTWKLNQLDRAKLAMDMFDWIIQNDDRHGGNWGYDVEKGHLYLIDNGFGRPWQDWVTPNSLSDISVRLTTALAKINIHSTARSSDILVNAVRWFLALNDHDIRQITDLPAELEEMYGKGIRTRIVACQQALRTVILRESNRANRAAD